MNTYTEQFMSFPVTPALVYLGMLLHIGAQDIINHYQDIGITPAMAAHDAQQAWKVQSMPWHYL